MVKIMPVDRGLHGAKRRQFFVEVELGFTREQAIQEAIRCLRCDAEI